MTLVSLFTNKTNLLPSLQLSEKIYLKYYVLYHFITYETYHKQGIVPSFNYDLRIILMNVNSLSSGKNVHNEKYVKLAAPKNGVPTSINGGGFYFFILVKINVTYRT